jgi:hypothetical protein
VLLTLSAAFKVLHSYILHWFVVSAGRPGLSEGIHAGIAGGGHAQGPDTYGWHCVAHFSAATLSTAPIHCCAQEGLASLRGSMLGLLEGDMPREGEPSPLAALDASESRKVGAVALASSSVCGGMWISSSCHALKSV